MGKVQKDVSRKNSEAWVVRGESEGTPVVHFNKSLFW